ncbi:MAG: DUF1292 domain-containing protein [Clostridiales bacterium]|jgi:uncharacterized protein YrzB (UPF0473 family)|nr:DUF1292 domain-containing protein [Clostridiales bacterium]
MTDKEKTAGEATNEEEIEIVELFDDEGKSMLFELLATIPESGKNYLLLTAYDENEQIEENDDGTIPSDVFIMQEVLNENGEKVLEPIEDVEAMERIFELFKKQTNDKYDFI